MVNSRLIRGLAPARRRSAPGQAGNDGADAGTVYVLQRRGVEYELRLPSLEQFANDRFQPFGFPPERQPAGNRDYCNPAFDLF